MPVTTIQHGGNIRHDDSNLGMAGDRLGPLKVFMSRGCHDQEMPENLLQRFLGHDHPATTQVYYEPARTQVKRAFRDAMGS